MTLNNCPPARKYRIGPPAPVKVNEIPVPKACVEQSPGYRTSQYDLTPPYKINNDVYDPSLDFDMEDYYYAAQYAKELKGKKEKDYDSFESSNSGGSLQADRKHRTDPAKIRPKFDKPYWDGTTSTFRAFKLALE